ncbi:hypothetical protein AB3R30_13340 [Leptolyngbyaceae cyanobacterium UHCC 1019]
MQSDQILERYRAFFSNLNTIAPEPDINGESLARWAAVLHPIAPSDPLDIAKICRC